MSDEKPEVQDETLTKAIALISEGAKLLGWAVAIPNGKEDDPVDGMILGTEQYINDMVEGYDERRAKNLSARNGDGADGSREPEDVKPDLD